MKIADYIGEGTDYDKKAALDWKCPRSWLKTVSAFANGTGGILIVGVDDRENLVGVEDPKHDMERITEIIRAKMDPVPTIHLSARKEEGRAFVLLDVRAGMLTPYYCMLDGTRTAYIRLGSSSEPATASDLRRLLLQGSDITYDLQPMSAQLEKENLTFNSLRAAYEERTRNPLGDSDYESFGIADHNGILTNAGALFADAHPLRHSRIFCTRWNGLEKAGSRIEASDDVEKSADLVTLLLSWGNTIYPRWGTLDYSGAKRRRKFFLDAPLHGEGSFFGSVVRVAGKEKGPAPRGARPLFIHVVESSVLP